MVESPPADAGDMGSCPGLERFHILRSGWAREPWPLSLRVRSLCPAAGEATAVRGPRTAKKKKKAHGAAATFTLTQLRCPLLQEALSQLLFWLEKHPLLQRFASVQHLPWQLEF